MDRILYIVGGLLFFGAVLAHLVVRLWMKPVEDEEDAIYWEFEDRDPDYSRYTRWLHGTMACGCLGLLLLFLAIAI